MSALYEAPPTFVAKPRGHGKYKLEFPPTYFIILDFLDLKKEPPDPVKLGVQLADLHENTISPNGKYGFPVTTYDGKWPQVIDWDSSWASFFSKMLRGALRVDVATNGPWKEVEGIVDQTVKFVIPLLLGFLETGGRSIKPCLIHGDLWEGNIGTEKETGRLYVYDAGSYYAHNEMELGMWRFNHHHLRGAKYRNEYLSNMKASAPAAQWGDRNRLYSCKASLLLSASFPESHFRSRAYQDLSYLVRAYSGEAGEVRAREAFGNDGAADALDAVGGVRVSDRT